MRRIAVIVVIALTSLAAAASSALASATTVTYHADGTANDVSGTHDGTWSGTSAYAAGSGGAAGDQSFSFNGSGSYIGFDRAVGTFGTDEATISFDIQTASPYHQQLMGARRYCDNPPEGWWEIGMRGAADPAPGHLTAEFGGQTASGAGTYTQALSTTPINDGQWHHIVIHRDNSGVSLSIDGAPAAFSPGPPANINPLVPFEINHSPCGVHPINGSIDEVNITRGSVPTDTSPPVISPTVTGTQGQNGWYTSNVGVSWSVSDPESAVSSTSGCGDQSVTSDTDSGGVTFTCTATSAGGTATKSVTIKRDTAPPVVTYTGNAGTYTVADAVNITCSASDPSPGSGLASSTCQNISGDAYTFALGSNSYSANATDNAGNVGTGSASFTVTVDPDSLGALTQRWVDNPGIAGALVAKLDAAKASIARGDSNSKEGQLGAYRNLLSAQSGKSIPADKAAILANLSQAI